jgi:hypothetical protein
MKRKSIDIDGHGQEFMDMNKVVVVLGDKTVQNASEYMDQERGNDIPRSEAVG